MNASSLSASRRPSSDQAAGDAAADPDSTPSVPADNSWDEQRGSAYWSFDLREGDFQSLFSWSAIAQRWHDNHGNWFLLATAGILAVGSLAMVLTPERPPAATVPALADPGQPDVEETAPASRFDGSGETAAGGPMIMIQIVGGTTDGGQLQVAIYGPTGPWNDPEEAALKTSLPPDQEGVAVWEVPAAELPDPFAVAAYHDSNGDGTLNRNTLGIPIERYGFSNNARGVVGPPTFQEAAVPRPEVGEPVRVIVR